VFQEKENNNTIKMLSLLFQKQ